VIPFEFVQTLFGVWESLLRFWIALVVLFVCGLFVGNEYLFSSHWNYRITVSVETPEGTKTGSVVRQVSAYNPMALNPDAPAMKFQVSGEAVVVDLGQRGVLFRLIYWNSYQEFFDAFPSSDNDVMKQIEFYNRLKVGEKAELKATTYGLVAFTDINNPKTILSVNTDNMKDIFGDGVSLKAITIERTNDPVTEGVIDTWLPWLNSLKGHYLHGGMTSRNAPLSLHSGNFKTKRN
jgi:hypothetical protein